MDCALKPAVGKRHLLLLAGAIWSCAGVVLLRFALRWIAAYPGSFVLPLLAVIGGLILGSMIALFGFRRIAKKNIGRILLLPERSCLFAFQKWHAYLLVVFMMSLGMFVRKTQLFPPLFLAAMYTGIGSALLGTSILYFSAAIGSKTEH